jgi:hypothetical protein
MRRAQVAAFAIVTGLACAVRAPAASAKGSDMQVTLTVTAAKVHKGNELEAKVVITNRTDAPVRLNALRLPYPSLVLKVRDAAGDPVALGPPPTPSADDGDSGRELIAPGSSVSYTYRAIFGSEPSPGTYAISFQSTQRKGPKGADWEGALASEWVKFEIVK